MLKRFISEDPIGIVGGINLRAYVDGSPVNLVDPTGEFGVPGAIAGGIIGGISGALGAAATGGNVWYGASIGALGGVVVGGSGAWVTTVAGQIGMRAMAGALGSSLGQAQRVNDPCFRFNYGAVIGSAVGGALAGVIAPAGYGTSFGPGVWGITQSAIAGIPGASVSTTGAIVGAGLGW